MNKIYKKSKDKNFKKKFVVCIAAGKGQVPVILKAKSLGYSVVAIDQNINAPGFRYADFKICQSTYDSNAIIKSLKKLNIRFVGILNRSSGPPVITTSKISHYFNIPGVPIKSAISLVNKDKMRSTFAKLKVPNPKYKIYSIKKYKTKGNFSFPFVIKPGLSLIGKSGVSVVNIKNKINNAIKYAEKYTINKKIIIEEFLEGPNISLISFVNNGKFFPIALLEEINMMDKNGKIFPSGYRTISANQINLRKKVYKIALTIISKFNIQRSPLMISFRQKPNKDLIIVEIHLDMGGDMLIEKFFPKAFSFDFLELAIKMATSKVKHVVNYKIKNVAIIFKNKIINDKEYKIITASTNKKLNEKISKLNT
jgi:biotin carboxylase